MAEQSKRELTREEDRLAKVLLRHFVLHQYSIGGLTDQDIEDGFALDKKIRKLIRNFDPVVILDYRESIEQQAFAFMRSNKFELSIMLYLTYFEHCINGIIVHRLGTKGFSEKEISQFLRSTNIISKFTWILRLLDLPNFNEGHRKTIMAGADARNAFVHYKYPAMSDQESLEDEKSVKHLLSKKLMKSAAYMKKYESRVLYSGKKGRLLELTKRASAPGRGSI